MKSGWLENREKVVSLLRVFALLLVFILLARTGIRVFQAVDYSGALNQVTIVDGLALGREAWYNIARIILEGITAAAYYGGAVFALSWIVSLIGRQDEVKAGSSWWGNRGKAISLLKILAISIVLLYLPIIVIRTFTAVDQEQSWDDAVTTILESITKAIYYGGTVFALSWIASLIGRRDEVNVGIGWLDNRESAISLLKSFAVLIVGFQLAIAVIEGFICAEWDSSWWGDTLRYILWALASGIFEGCILLALAWVVSLIGEREAHEAGDTVEIHSM
ncbi:hypothetical protein ACFLW2_02165 [Chloroflexota bacterium]